VGYGYDGDGNLTSMSDVTGLTSYGNRTSTTYPGNTVMRLDHTNRPMEIKTSNGSTVLADFCHTYTNAGEDTELVQTRTDHATGKVTAYGYDAANELIKATETSGSTITAQ
jgi:YD repeat-containing protein